MNELTKTLVLLFKYCRTDDKNLFDLYYNRLKTHDTNKVVKNIENIIDTKTDTYLPAIGLIIDAVSDKSSQMEEDWLVFLRERENNFRYLPMADWVYTIKKHIGLQRCDDVTKKDLHWLKKEFSAIYPLMRNGSIRLLGDPLNGDSIMVGNITTLLSVPRNDNLSSDIFAGNYEEVSPDRPKEITGRGGE